MSNSSLRPPLNGLSTNTQKIRVWDMLPKPHTTFIIVTDKKLLFRYFFGEFWTNDLAP